MAERWYEWALNDIDAGILRNKRLNDFEKQFLETVRPRIAAGLFLSEKQEKVLMNIQQKITEPSRLRR